MQVRGSARHSRRCVLHVHAVTTAEKSKKAQAMFSRERTKTSHTSHQENGVARRPRTQPVEIVGRYADLEQQDVCGRVFPRVTRCSYVSCVPRVALRRDDDSLRVTLCVALSLLRYAPQINISD